MMHSMKKRLLAGLMTVIMVFSAVMPVFATTEEQSRPQASENEAVILEEPVEKTTPEQLTNRNIHFYAYVDGKLTQIENRTNVTTYWIDGRQCIDTATLVAVYGKLGFKAADLTAGSKLFLHTDMNQGTIWAEAAKAVDGIVYAAAVNHKDTGYGGAPGNEFEVFYLPCHSVGSSANKDDAATIAKETFYTVTTENGSKEYHLNGTDVVIERDAAAKDWTCTGTDGQKVEGVVANGKVTFKISAIAQAYTLTATDKPVPQPIAVTAKVNGKDVSGSTLSDLITKSGVATDDVQTLEFVSGKLTKEDCAYIKESLVRMTTMTLNVSDTMQLLDNSGKPTTVLGEQTASFVFGKPSNWSKGGLKTLNVSGITEVQKGAIKSDSVETLNLPDVVTVGDSSLSELKWLETVSLPKAKTIGKSAFFNDSRLENLTLNAVETLGDNAFAYTDELRELTLPETIKEIGAIGFNKVHNGNKSGTIITIKATTPPSVKGAPFNDVGTYYNPPIVAVPASALEAYIRVEHSNVDLTKFVGKDDLLWNCLHVRAEGSHVLKYYNSERSWETKYAFVKDGDTVKAAQIPTATAPEGKMFKGWNTDKNGKGVWVNEQMKPSELPRYPNNPNGERYSFDKAIEVYPIFVEEVNLTAKVNGTESSGKNLADVIAHSGVAADDVQTLEFVSGKLTKEDRAYIKESLVRMTTMTLNVSETMQLLDNSGKPTTVLGEQTATLEFGIPSGWNKGGLETLNMSGITEVQQGAIKSSSVKTLNLPDVLTVGDSSLGGFDYLETLNLPKAKTVGKYAFMYNRNLENLTLNAVEALGEGSFKYTDSLTRLTLPETIKEIGDIRFGITRQGNKSGTVITIKAMTPPTVNSGAFQGVSSLTREALVVVPQGALAAYVHQNHPNADVTKYLSINDSIWNNLYIREEGTFTIKYYNSAKSWDTKYAFVKDGNAVTDAQIPAFAEDDTQLFLGWNSKKNGTGDMIVPGFKPTDHMTVTPVVVDAVTITVDLGESTQTIKVAKGKPIGDKLPAAPEKDENHDFAGWVDEVGNVVTEKTVAQKNMTIHPTWFEDFNHNDIDDATEPHYTVIYSDAGLHPANPAFEAKVFENILVGMPTPSFGDVPVREGEVFGGWDPQISDTVTSDILYNAIWYKDENHNNIPDKDEERFTVTYTDGLGGIVFEDRVFGELLDGVETPVFTGELEREGYMFGGWDPGVSVTVTENVVYTAIWKEDRNHNGIPDDDDIYHDIIITDGMDQEVFEDTHLVVLTGTKLDVLNTDPSYEGYTFKGWKDQNGNAVTAETVVTSDMTIIAVFEKNETPDKPVDPEVPTTPTTPTTPTKPVDPDAPATGDTAHVAVWMMLATFTLVGTAWTMKKRRQYK